MSDGKYLLGVALSPEKNHLDMAEDEEVDSPSLEKANLMGYFLRQQRTGIEKKRSLKFFAMKDAKVVLGFITL